MELYLGYPIFIWEGLINFVSVVVAGLVIAFITTFYLKKKDEKTRVAGVILEKRVNAQHEILQFVESNTQKFEMLQSDAIILRELILSHDLELPYDPQIQYADIFSSVDKFHKFFHGFESILEKHKLWLDLKVRHQMLLMNSYFASINAMLVSFNRLPLPNGVKLNKKDFTVLGNKLLLILGAGLDEEFNFLVMDLEVLMVNSIYKLDLTRPKSGFFSKRKASKEVKRVENFLYNESLLGEYIRITPILIIQILQAYKNIEINIEEAMDYYMKVANTSGTDKPHSFL